MKKNAEYFFYKAYEAYQKNEFIQAKIHFEKSIELNPNYANAYNNLANLLQNDYFKEYIQAKKYYEKAIELNPNYTDAYNNLANLLQNDYFKEYKQAKKYYEKAIELNPNYANAYYNLAILLQNDYFKEYKQAKKYYEKAIQINNEIIFTGKTKVKLINDASKNIYKNKENIKAYALKQFKIFDFKGIKYIAIADFPIDTQWIFLTGENAMGKTSILEALTIALCDDDGNLLKNITKKNNLESAQMSVEVHEKDTNIINDTSNLDNFTRIKYISAYSAIRTFLSKSYDDSTIEETFFQEKPIMSNIEKKLTILDSNKELKPFLNLIIDLLKKLIPNLQDIKVEINEYHTGKYVRYKEKDNEDYMNFDKLAMGMKGIIGFIGDFLIKFTKDKAIKTTKDIEGIVIIDEFDNHLHPKWQKNLVQTLSELFPNVQFIVSTHSPIPLLGAPANTIILNVERNEQDGIIVKKLDVDFSTLTPNAILTSPIFGFDNIIPISKPNDEFVNTEDNYQKIVEKEKQRKEITNYLSDEKTEKLLKLLDKE